MEGIIRLVVIVAAIVLYDWHDAKLALIDELLTRQAQGTTEEEYRRLIHAAGFAHMTSILSIMGSAICAWIAR